VKSPGDRPEPPRMRSGCRGCRIRLRCAQIAMPPSHDVTASAHGQILPRVYDHYCWFVGYSEVEHSSPREVSTSVLPVIREPSGFWPLNADSTYPLFPMHFVRNGLPPVRAFPRRSGVTQATRLPSTGDRGAD
jgi:hypothetical protein